MSRLAAVRGAVGFCTRLPIGKNERTWEQFRASPWAFPAVGFLIGAVVALPVAAATAGLARETAAVLSLAAVYGVTGIVHLDGVADVGDAAVVHGDADERRTVLKDTTTGVGALAAVTLTITGLAFGLYAVTRLPGWLGVAVVVASEVGAKLAMGTVACFGVASHEGLGSAFTSRSGPRGFVPAAVVALPAGLVAVPRIAPIVSVVGATLAGLVVLQWASRRLGGVNGDVFGAANELGRVVGLHAGVIVWTLS